MFWGKKIVEKTLRGNNCYQTKKYSQIPYKFKVSYPKINYLFTPTGNQREDGTIYLIDKYNQCCAFIFIKIMNQLQKKRQYQNLCIS